MTEDRESYERFRRVRCCCVIPTYNNGKTLGPVLDRILAHTNQVILVNDGSTDDTYEILKDYDLTEVIHLPRNHGKGFAIRTGIRIAYRLGFRYAITIDSDGQHYPEDLPSFLDLIEEEPGMLVIGSRNMNAEGIPGKSSFGNRFSNFWFWIETGLKLPDTQSGYRLYPLDVIGRMKFVTRRFEFEVEVLVRAAWKGVPFRSIPVWVIYPDKNERVSHFRPFRDFLRISLLNTVLVLLALLFVRPVIIAKGINRESIRLFLINHLLDPRESNFIKAASVAVGVFFGIAPVWGWQMIAAFSTAMMLKLNKAIALVASNISIPPMIPIILFASYRTGGVLLNKPVSLENFDGITFEYVRNNLFQYVLGALVFAAAMAVISGLVTYIILLVFRRRKREIS